MAGGKMIEHIVSWCVRSSMELENALSQFRVETREAIY